MSRAEQRAQRQEALIEGAVAVLHEHGLEGFTTGRIAAQAGIAQSGFYKYFDDRDACLQAVANHIGLQVLVAVRTARLQVGSDRSQLAVSFAGALRAMLAPREATALMLRFRREPGPLGELYRALINQAVAELRTDVQALGLVKGADADRLARYCVMLTVSAVEALLDGDLADLDTVATDLAGLANAVLDGRT